MAEKENRVIPFDAGWPLDLQHRPDPNRVSGPPTEPRGRTATEPLSRNPAPAPMPAFTEIARAATPPMQHSADGEASYYDISILKAPLWKWEIASYFFLGGLSAGAYIIGRVAEIADEEKYRDVGRAAAYTSLLTFLPCPPLLIHDLGDPKRFHHMMRVWKPSSPMNLGTWTILGFSGMSGAEALRQWMLDRFPREQRGPVLRLINRFMETLHDAAGIPFAILVAGYTGVLLSCTANPLWSRNRWLGPLFSASAIATGAGATTLALSATGRKGGSEASHRALETIDTAAHVAEAVCLHRFMKEAEPASKVLTRGPMKTYMAVAVGGLVASEVIKRLPLSGRPKRVARGMSAVVGLASGFCLRWAIVHGGHPAANNPRLARASSTPTGQLPQLK